jgi:AhpD family alkylhydroperoxidase
MLPHRMKSRIFDSVSKMPIRYVRPVPFSEAQGLVRDVYDQVADEFFINGAITTHSVRPPLLAGMWCGGREIVMVDSVFEREIKESLGVSFAQVNGCTYCEDMMISVVHGTTDHKLAETIRAKAQDDIADPRLRDLHRWATRYRDPAADIIRRPPFSAAEAPEMFATALMFNYLNRYVKIFFDGTPLNPPFSSHSLKTAMFYSFGMELRATVTKRLSAGRAAALLPDAPLPADLGWSAANPGVATALARWAAAIDRHAAPDIPEKCRNIVTTAIAEWRGEDKGLSRSWVEPYLDGLDAAERAATKLALITAFSPTQMSDGVAEEFRRHYQGDAALVGLVSWSAFSAARRVAAWLAEAAGDLREEKGPRVAA